MRIETFDQREKFREAARPVLDQEALENSLATDVMGQFEQYETLRMLGVIESGQRVGIALQTLPFPMQVVAAPEARESAPAADGLLPLHLCRAAGAVRQWRLAARNGFRGVFAD